MSLSLLKEIIGHIKSSACPTDVVPPCLFKEIYETIGPNIQIIMNSSLASGVVPANFKHAVVKPLIKKPNLDTSALSNFRPISQLPFLLKFLEKVVLLQLQSFLGTYDILEVFQSGFKALHSTESVLLKVFNNLLLATDWGFCHSYAFRSHSCIQHDNASLFCGVLQGFKDIKSWIALNFLMRASLKF